MNILMQNILEILVTFIESVLFFYYIIHRIAPGKYFRIGTAFFLTAMTVTTSILNYYNVNANISLFAALAFEILFTFCFMKGTVTEKLAWGCFYRMMDLFAEGLTFLLLDIITNYSSSTLMTTYPMRYILCAVYLILLAAFTFVISHIQRGSISLPHWILPLFVFLIVIGILAVESLLDVIIYLDSIENYTQNDTLYRAIWIFLSILLFILLLIFYLNHLYQRNLKLLEIQQAQQIEEHQYELVSNNVQMLRVWKHDSRQHLSVIEKLISSENYEDAITYIHDINQDFVKTQFGIFTGNSILDAVISTKIISIRRYDIKFEHSIYLPEFMPFDHLSLSSLMGNLFDNAITACSQVEDTSKRYILLTIKPHQNSLSIRMENSSTGRYRYDIDHQLCSTKPSPNHGIGLRRIQEISESASGFCQIDPKPDKFTVTIVVPLKVSAER